MKRKLSVLLSCALALTTLPGFADIEIFDARMFKPEDIFKLEYAADPQISPNGKRLVYVRTAMDIMTDGRTSNLWIVNTDGSEHRPLLSGKQQFSSPRWSPNGGRIAYISTQDGAPQIYVRWMDTGQTALISNLTEAPADLTWSPDGKSLAFTMNVNSGPAPSFATPPQKPAGATWAEPFQVIDKAIYRFNGKGYLPYAYKHIFVVPAEGGTPRQLSSGDFDHGGPLSWSPDSTTLYFSANRNEDSEMRPLKTDIYALSVTSRDIQQLTNRAGPDDTPAVSPDGKLIAFTGYDDRGIGHQDSRLYVMNNDGSGKRVLTADIDLGASNPQWSSNGRGIYVTYVERGVAKLGYINAKGGKLQEVASGLSGPFMMLPAAFPGNVSIATDGTFALTLGDVSNPSDVGVGRVGRNTKKITALNDDLLSYRYLAKVEELTWTSSADGLEIQGWLALPPNFDPTKKYPLILEIHGGPEAAWGPYFSTLVQRATAEGYLVLFPNPRGSTSYGQDFVQQIRLTYPGKDYDDLMSGVDSVIKRGYVDEKQLFVTGLSGGGVLTSWTVGKTDRFAAAVARGPVINWISHSLSGDLYPMFQKRWFSAPPWEDPMQYWQRSPLSLVGNVSTPTMLMTGLEDYRTPIWEAEQFYQALKLRGVDTALVRVPNAPHFMGGRPSNQIMEIETILGWFEKYRAE